MSHILTIKDYKSVRTPFVFMDETGSINDKSNRFFALGIIKCMQPHFLDSDIRLIRQKNNFYDEFKFNKISRKNIDVVKKVIDLVFATPGIRFSAIIINKDNIDFSKEFNNDPYEAYQKFAELLLKRSIKRNEILIVLADYLSTPNHIHFEVDLKHTINKSFERLAIAGIHRVESNGTNIIQVVDLILGSMVYKYKLDNKIVNGDKNKIKIANYILKKLETDSFSNIKLN